MNQQQEQLALTAQNAMATFKRVEKIGPTHPHAAQSRTYDGLTISIEIDGQGELWEVDAMRDHDGQQLVNVHPGGEMLPTVEIYTPLSNALLDTLCNAINLCAAGATSDGEARR